MAVIVILYSMANIVSLYIQNWHSSIIYKNCQLISKQGYISIARIAVFNCACLDILVENMFLWIQNKPFECLNYGNKDHVLLCGQTTNTTQNLVIIIFDFNGFLHNLDPVQVKMHRAWFSLHVICFYLSRSAMPCPGFTYMQLHTLW